MPSDVQAPPQRVFCKRVRGAHCDILGPCSAPPPGAQAMRWVEANAGGGARLQRALSNTLYLPSNISTTSSTVNAQARGKVSRVIYTRPPSPPRASVMSAVASSINQGRPPRVNSTTRARSGSLCISSPGWGRPTAAPLTARGSSSHQFSLGCEVTSTPASAAKATTARRTPSHCQSSPHTVDRGKRRRIARSSARTLSWLGV